MTRSNTPRSGPPLPSPYPGWPPRVSALRTSPGIPARRRRLMRRPASLWRIVASVSAGTLILLGSAAPAVAGPKNLCAAQQQAVDNLKARIHRHNAQPHVFVVPQQQAQAQAYDTEAAALRAESMTARANLRSCLQALHEPIGVKPGWTPRLTRKGDGIIWQRPGADRDSDSVRIMFPNANPARYPNGYVRFYNRGNQPLGLDGKTGPKPHTHVPRNPDGTYPLPKGW